MANGCREKSGTLESLALLIWILAIAAIDGARTKSIFNFTRSFYVATMPENARGRVYAVPQDGKMGVYLAWTIVLPQLGDRSKPSDIFASKISSENATVHQQDHQQLVRFRIVSGDKHNYFKVESEIVGDFAYLRIRTRSSLDVDLNRELTPEFSLRIKAVYRRQTNGFAGGGRNLETRTEVLLKITDQNDLSPVFLPENYRVSIERRKAMFSSLVRVTASDADDGLNGEVYYQLMNRTDYFTVHPTSGVITLIKPLPEVPRIFNLSIAAVDRASRLFPDSRSNQGYVNLAKVDIEVLDGNSIASKSFWTIRTAAEEFQRCGLVADALCATITTTEKADEPNIKSDDESSSYFYVQRSEDWRMDEQKFEVRSTSIVPTGAYNLSFHSTAPNMVIQVNSSNGVDHCDRSFGMNKTEFIFDVPEWAPDGFLVGQFGLDPNIGDVRFELRKAEDEAEKSLPFMVTAETGLLYLKLGKNGSQPLNFKRRSAYEFFTHVRRRKCHEKEERRAVVVRIKDCNDHAPKFIDQCDRLIFSFDRPPLGKALCKFLATDEDAGENGRIHYDLVPDPTSVARFFHVDHFGGELSLKNQSSFFLAMEKNKKKSYSFIVRAFDHGWPLKRVSEKEVVVLFNDSASGKADWTVESGDSKSLELIHSNRHAPSVSPEWTFEVLENARSGHRVGTVEASDLDSGYAGVLLYSIDLEQVGSAFFNERPFDIDLYNGTIYVLRPLDREKRDRYSFKVTIMDLGRPSRRTSANVVIKVLDVNDNAPRFEKSAYRVQLKEDAEPGLAILQLKAFDEDLERNGRIGYSLVIRTPYFGLDSDTGVLTLKSPVDREKMDEHRLLVKAQDHGHPSLSAFVNVTVIIEDMNDNVPACRVKSTKAFVPEDYPANALITCIDGDDADVGDNGRISYRLIDNTKKSVNDEAPFIVDSATGCIRLSSMTNASATSKNRKGVPSYLELLLDYERQPFYNLTVELADFGKSRQLKNYCNLFVEVLDVDENRYPPKFVDSDEPADEDETIFAMEAEIYENEQAPTFLKQLRAFDPDAAVIMVDSKPIYSIVDGDGLGIFTIDQDGRIYASRSLDRETKPYYWLTVAARDRAAAPLSSSVDIFVRILDRNDNPPMPSKGIYYASIMENSPPNVVVLRIDATDADFLSQSPPSSEGEEIDEEHGQESDKVDPQATVQSLMTFKISRGDPQSFFKIDSRTGYISTDRRALDRETTPELELEVTISDNGEPEPLVSAVTVVVRVEDENDHAPTFPMKMMNFDVPDRKKKKGRRSREKRDELFLCRVFAYDEDQGKNGEIRYSISEGNEQGFVRIDAETGSIFALENSTWSDNQPLMLVVRATDSGNPPKSTERTVHLTTVADALDKELGSIPLKITSDFVTSPLHVAIADPIGHHVGLVEAMLADGGDGFRIWYYLRGGNDDNAFTLVPDTGVLLLAKKPTLPTYSLTFFATVDGVNRVEGKITVVVQPIVDDERPQFSMDHIPVKVSENQSANSLLLQLPEYLKSAYDREEIRFFLSENYYVINQSSGEGIFQVDPKSGAVYLKQTLDREHQARYSFRIGARSRRGKRGYAVVDVQVLDVNDHAPKFVNRHVHVRISQSTSPGTIIHQLAAFDGDEGANGKLTYSLSSGNHKDAFAVDPQTGALRLSRSLTKADSASEFVLTVKVEDGGRPPLYDSAMVRILLTAGGLNDDGSRIENVAKFTHYSYAFRVSEKLAAGALIGNVQAIGGAAIEYGILEDQGGYFDVHPLSGAVLLRRSFDFEHSKHVEATVRAWNSANAHTSSGATARIAVDVIDGNDHAPVFKELFYEASVEETAPVGTVLLRVEALDQDSGQAGIVTYHIVDSLASQYFDVDYHTGAIRLMKQLDFDQGQLRFEFSVAAEDLGQPKMYSGRPTLVEIKVLDANDQPPVFNQSEHHFTIYTPAVPGLKVGAVSAMDKDTVGTVKYFMRRSPICQALEIDGSGLIRLSPRWDSKIANSTFTCIVVATDGLHETSSNVTLKLTPFVPSTKDLRFEHNEYELSIMENSSTLASGIILLHLRTLGAEPDEPILFSILNSSNDSDEYFSLTRASGHLMTTDSTRFLDRESTPTLTYVVEAKMARRPSATARTLVKIRVLDENDNAPKFIGSPYSFSVSTRAAKNESVFRVVAIDLDEGPNAKVKYSLEPGQQYGSLVRIDPESGELFAVGDLKQLKERGVGDLRISVVATDQGASPLSSTTLIQIRLVSGSTPIFPTPFYNVSVFEGPRGVNTEISGANAFGVLALPHTVLGFTFVEDGSESFGSYFDLDFSTGRLVLRKPLDRRQNQIQLRIRATDFSLSKSENQDSWSDATVLINVLDDNNHAPIFDSPFYVVNVQENASVNGASPLLVLNATDDDEGANSQLSFSLQSINDHGEEYFRLNAETGILTLAKRLDYETKRNFVLTAVAKDFGSPPLSGTAKIYVHVQDVNDNAPAFSQLAFEVELPSASWSVGQFIGQALASDPDQRDRGRLRYSVFNGNVEGWFSIDENSGVIRTARHRSADDLSISEYPLNLTVTDGVHSASCRFLIKISPGATKTTNFFKTLYQARVKERASSGTFVTEVRVEDKIGIEVPALRYRLVGSSLFRIEETTGKVFTARLLDANSRAVHSVTILAEKWTDFTIAAHCQLQITVISENNRPPKFLSDRFFATVSAETKPNVIILKIQALDMDRDDTLEYSFDSKSPNNFDDYFFLDFSTGALAVRRNLESAIGSVFKTTLRATDRGNPPQRTTASLEIRIVGETANEAVANFKTLEHIFTVRENANVGTEIGRVDTARRSTNSEQHRFSIATPRSITKGVDWITLDEKTGSLRVAERLDRESMAELQFYVSLLRSGSQDVISMALVRILIEDVDDNGPTFENVPENGAVVAYVAEDSPVGSLVTIFGATDPDSGEDGRVFYSLENRDSSINLPFKIDSELGWLRTTSTLDRESLDKFSFLVLAGSSNGAHQKATVNVTVIVTDANDQKPIFEKDEYEFEIANGLSALPGLVIGRVLASDADLPPNNEVRYYLINGNERGLFDVRSTGEIYLARSMEPTDSKADYGLTILASDGLFEDTALAKVTMNLDPTAKCDFNFTCSKLISITVSEDAPVGNLVGRLDKLPNGFSYHLDDAADLDFVIKDSGEILVSRTLDYERRQAYGANIGVNSTNPCRLDCITRLSIKLEDVNDCAPEFDPNAISNEISIVENYNGTFPYLLGRVHALDGDSGLNGRIRYWLSVDGGKGDGLFTVDNASGALFLWRPLDREKKEFYNLTTTAEDSGHPKSLSSHMAVLIRVLDVNDNPPVFAQNSYEVSAPEDTPVGVILMHVEAVSADVGDNALISYKIEKSMDADVFELNERTGEIRLKKSLDYEKSREHSAVITAVDGGEPPLSTRTQIRLRVLDVNDNDPIFERRHYTLRVPENATVQSRLIRILATDLDSERNGRVEYRIEPTNRYFHTANTRQELGWIILSEPLDYEKSTRHEFQVMAYDQGQPSRSSVAVVTVEVIDVNDNQPRILNCNRTVVVKAHVSTSTPLLLFQVSDADGPTNGKPYHFSIIDSPIGKGVEKRSTAESAFKLDSHGSLFSSQTPLELPEYFIQIRVKDSGDPPLSSICRLHVRITDESRFPPRLVNTSFLVLSYMGEMGSGGVVGRVLALDDDPKDSLRYSIFNVTGSTKDFDESPSEKILVKGHDSSFSIDPDDGRILAAAELRPGEYFLNVSASDGRFETFGVVNVDIRSITSKMLDHAVSLRISGLVDANVGGRHRRNTGIFDERVFVENHLKALTRAVASAVNARSARHVHVLSVQKAADRGDEELAAKVRSPKKLSPRMILRKFAARTRRSNQDDGGISKRTASHGVDILIAVQKSHHQDYFKPEYVRKTVEQKLSEVERISNTKIVSLVTEMCRSDLCKNGGVCRERLHLYDTVNNAILTETFSFVSPTHRRWAECVCGVGFGGQFCEEELNECAKRPCPSGRVCVATEKGVAKGNGEKLADSRGYRCLCSGIGCPSYDSVHMVSSRSWIRCTLSENLETQMKFSISFRTVARSGILLFSSGRSDFQSLELFGGQLRYRYDLGDGEALVYVDGRPSVDDGLWHTVHLERNRRSAKLTLDNRRPQTVNAPGDAFVLNLHGADIYLGSGDAPDSGFVGCLKGATLNDDVLPWHGAGIQMHDVDIGRCTDDSFKRILTAAAGSKTACGWCLNNGTCISGDPKLETAWSCVCPAPFTGLRCESLMHKYGVFGACQPSPCHNGATCVADKTSAAGFRCRCPLGYVGRTCSISGTDPCVSDPCANGAACVQITSTTGEIGFYCNCTSGWTGMFCRQAVAPNIIGGLFGITLPELLGIVAIFVVLILLTVVIVLLCRRKTTFRRKKYLQRRGPSSRNNHGESEPMFSESDVTPSAFAQRPFAGNMFVSGGPCGAMVAVSDANSASTPISPAACSAPGSFGNGHGNPPPLPPRRGFQPHRGSKLSNLESALSTGIPTVQVRPLSMSERQSTPVEGGLARATGGGYLETAANYGSAAEELEKLGRRMSPSLDELEDWKAALNQMNADSLEKLKEAAGITDDQYWQNDGASRNGIGPSSAGDRACASAKIGRRRLPEEERSSGKSGAYNWDYSDWNSTIGHAADGPAGVGPYATLSHLSMATDDDYGTGTLPRGVCRLEETDTEYAANESGTDDHDVEDKAEAERKSRLRGDEFTKELMALTKSFGRHRSGASDSDTASPGKSSLSTFTSPTRSNGGGVQSYLDRYLPKPVEPPNSTASERKLLLNSGVLDGSSNPAVIEQFSDDDDDDEEFVTPSGGYQSSLLDASRLSEVGGCSDGERSTDSVVPAPGMVKRKESTLVVCSISDDEEEEGNAKVDEGKAINNNRTFVKKSKKQTQV